MGEDWCALDVAGGPEFARMGGAALVAADAAVLCVAPDPDEAVLAAPWLRAIEAANVPCFLFINRMDTPKGRVRDIVSALQAYTSHTVVLRQIPIREGGEVVGAVDLISERAWRYREGQTSQLVEMPKSEADREHEARAELLEQMSDYDDKLLEELIEDREPATGALFEIAKRETQHRDVIPTFLGAASHRNGVHRLMKALRHEAPGLSVLKERLGVADAVAVGFHAQIRKHLGKCVMLRALDAGVKVGSQLAGDNLGGLAEIGGKSGNDHLEPGEVGISVKSDQLEAGRIFSAKASEPVPDWAKGCPPALARIVMPAHERDEVRLSSALSRLAEADPMLRLGQDQGSGHALLRLQGPMHERHTLAVLADDFGVEVTTHVPDPLYLETISSAVDEHYRHRKQSGGAGQFADVAITLRPAGRGEGFSFDEVVKGGSVPKNYIPSVEEGAREALDKGPLGFPVTDLSVTLTDGKHHSVDSSDFAFRTAGRMAIRDALTKAGPVLLQPIDRLDIHVPSVYSGAMVSLISSLKGQVLGFDGDPDYRGWEHLPRAPAGILGGGAGHGARLGDAGHGVARGEL